MWKFKLLPGPFLNLWRPPNHVLWGAYMIFEKVLYMFRWHHVTTSSRTETLACLFRGVEVMGPLGAVPSLQFSTGVPGIGVFEGFREPKKWMCFQLCFHVKGQTKNTTGQKEPGKGKKNTLYPQNVFLNIFFLCSLIPPLKRKKLKNNNN